MPNENVSTLMSASPAGPSMALTGEQENQSMNLWSLIQDRMAGRWHLAIPLGLVFSITFAAVGYLMPTPKYTSEGVVRVVPWISPVLHELPETGMLPFYDKFVQTQASYVQSDRVLRKALEDEKLRSSVSWSGDQRAVVRLRENLSVDADRRSELITVSYTAEKPEVAHAVVNAVLRSYDAIYGQSDDQFERKRQTLRELQDELRFKISSRRREISQAEYGVEELASLVQMELEAVKQKREEIARLKDLLPRLEARAPAEGESEQAANTEPEPTAKELDALDSTLADLRRRLEARRVDFELVKDRWHPSHPRYQDAERKLQVVESMFQDREARAIEQWKQLQREAELAGAAGPMLQSPAQARERLQQLENERDQALQRSRQLSADKRELEQIQKELEDLQQEQETYQARLQGLETEKEALQRGRILIAAWGEKPVSPSQDRRPELAAIGTVGGMGLALAMFFALGTLNPKTTGVNQLRKRGDLVRCLGVIPQMAPADHEEEHTVAAHCIHLVRNQIDAALPTDTAAVVAISSPYQGDGKTSVTTALGWSYASGGVSTVLVDCDLLGAGLTRRMGLTNAPGVRDFIETGQLNENVVDVGVPGLHILPAGLAHDIGPERLRKRDLNRLFAQLRERFEFVLVDTGPVISSLESIPIAASTDGVLLVVRRGGGRLYVDECVRNIQSVGGTCLGVVLNCAADSDCGQYTSASMRSAVAENGSPSGSAVRAASIGRMLLAENTREIVAK